jgi:hypothetical protein
MEREQKAVTSSGNQFAGINVMIFINANIIVFFYSKHSHLGTKVIITYNGFQENRHFFLLKLGENRRKS